MGDSREILKQAADAIEKKCGKLCKQSALYRSQAWGYENQPEFINQVIEIETDLAPCNLITTILSIEKELGRSRGKEKWQARSIDIDILFYENVILDEPDLTIPHPRIAERNFTLVPLMEIAPDFVHPVLGTSIEELYLQCADHLEVQMIES